MQERALRGKLQHTHAFNATTLNTKYIRFPSLPNQCSTECPKVERFNLEEELGKLFIPPFRSSS